MATRIGPILLILGVILVIPVTAILTPALRAHSRAFEQGAVAVLRFTPPIAAAKLVTHAPALASAGWVLLMVGWLAGLGGALVALEWKPLRASRFGTVAGAEATWGGVYDRVAAAFGPTLAPLASKTLRSFFRSPKIRSAYAISVFLPLLLAFVFARGRADPLAGFLVVVAVVGYVGYAGTGSMTNNLFGPDRAGFRRYFLVPVSPATVLRAVALVPLLLGLAAVPVSLGLWLVFWRGAPRRTHGGYVALERIWGIVSFSCVGALGFALLAICRGP